MFVERVIITGETLLFSQLKLIGLRKALSAVINSDVAFWLGNVPDKMWRQFVAGQRLYGVAGRKALVAYHAAVGAQASDVMVLTMLEFRMLILLLMLLLMLDL